MFDFRLLRPANEILNCLPRGTYSAVHVRRTDHVNLKHVPEDSYSAFITRSNNNCCYIAADNAESYHRIQSAVQRSDVETLGKHAWRNGHRKTDLKQAVIDLYACKNADCFMGQPGSSFSDAIELLREPDAIIGPRKAPHLPPRAIVFR